jgi:hypothetical protein
MRVKGRNRKERNMVRMEGIKGRQIYKERVQGSKKKKRKYSVRFQVLMAESVRNVFWDVAPCILVELGRLV